MNIYISNARTALDRERIANWAAIQSECEKFDANFI